MDKIQNWISLIMDWWMKIYETDQETFVAIGLVIGILCVLGGFYLMWMSIKRLQMDVADKLWGLLMLLSIVMVLAWIIIFFTFTIDVLEFYI